MPFSVGSLVSPQLIILATLVTASLLEGLLHQREAIGIVAFWTYLALAAGATYLAFDLTDRSAALLLFLLVPTGILFGSNISRSGRRGTYITIIVFVASANAAISIFEKVFVVSVFGRDDFLAATGAGKGIVASDHPLILGTMLAVTIPLVAAWTAPIRLPVAALLLGGAWATNAVGPTVVGAGLFVVSCSPVVFRAVCRLWRVVAVGIVAVWALLAWASLTLWHPTVPQMDLDGYSNGYRAAMYSMAPKILAAAPLGYGPGGPDPGEWVIQTSLKGPKDLGLQVDSELMLLILDFGWLGVALFAATFFVGIRALRRYEQFGLALLGMSACGFFLSLHAWGGPSSYWMLILGVALTTVDEARAIHPGASRVSRLHLGRLAALSSARGMRR